MSMIIRIDRSAEGRNAGKEFKMGTWQRAEGRKATTIFLRGSTRTRWRRKVAGTQASTGMDSAGGKERRRGKLAATQGKERVWRVCV